MGLAAIPKTSAPRQGKSPVPCWTDKCSEVTRDKKRALNRLKRSPLPVDYIKYKKARAITRKTIKEAKRKGWQEFCTNIDSKTSTRDVWNKLKCISKTKSYKGIPTLLDKNKQCVVTDKEKADLLAESFAAVSSTANYMEDFQEIKDYEESKFEINNDNKEAPINDDFMIDELNFAIDKAKSTTPGIDGISIGILRYLPAVSRLVLLHIFNIIWDRGDCSCKWKEAVLTPLAKPGKDPTSPLSYRHIALTASICKVMERMINNRLQWFLEQNNLISNVQSGFRTGRRTIDHLTHLESTINMGRANVTRRIRWRCFLIWRRRMTWFGGRGC